MLIDVEKTRLEALHALDILDTEPESAFDRLTEFAAELFDTPIALVSLVDADRQWFKSVVGLEVRQTPRAVAFCAHAIVADDVFVVEDASSDPRFCRNPLVTGAPEIRFYAGAPIRTETGERLGTVCVIDRKPRQFSARDASRLEKLAACAMSEMALRKALKAERDAREVADQALVERRKFVARISHEIRTPLNAVLGFERLVREAELSEEQALYLAAIRKSGVKLREFVWKLLDSELAPEVLAAGQFDLVRAIREEAEHCEEMAIDRRVDVVINSDGAIISHGVDEAAFRQFMRPFLARLVEVSNAGNVIIFARQRAGAEGVSIEAHLEPGEPDPTEATPHLAALNAAQSVSGLKTQFASLLEQLNCTLTTDVTSEGPVCVRIDFSGATVNRRAKLTPYRRPKLTPPALW